MTRTLTTVFLALTVVALGSTSRALAHEGHDHTVMGTVTMAMADHVMLKDLEGKDVTIQVTKTTKVKSKPVMKVADIKAGTRVVVIAEMEKDKMIAKEIQVGAAAK